MVIINHCNSTFGPGNYWSGVTVNLDQVIIGLADQIRWSADYSGFSPAVKVLKDKTLD